MDKESLVTKNHSYKKAYLISFFLPFTIYLVIGVVLRLYPISDNTVLFSDMNNQFVSFYTYFKSMVTTNNNIFYTFSKNLGGDMIGFAAYYLTNPFLFILFLFPDKYLPAGIYLMEIIMLSTAGMTMQVFFVKVYRKSSIAFSTAYSMMGYVLAYFTLPIYFCNIILLPLVMIGLHNIVKSASCIRNTADSASYIHDSADGKTTSETLTDSDKKPSKENVSDLVGHLSSGHCVYIICLALSIIANYYIGYMLCLFLGLYFIYLCIAQGKVNIKSLISFIINSLLAVMLSCVYLIPVALSLRGQKNAPDSGIMTLRSTFSVFGFYTSLLPCTFTGNYANNAFPYVYIGIISILFVGYFFISKRIAVREKLASAFLIFAMFLCLYIQGLNVIWHAFNEPVGFAHRFAFYFSFVLLEVAFRGYLQLREKVNEADEGRKTENSRKTEKSRKAEKSRKTEKSRAGVKQYGKYIGFVICTLLICELSLNAYHSLKIQVAGAKTQSEYESFYEDFYPVIEGIKEYDEVETEKIGSLYRVEKDFQYNMEDAMTFDYIGLTHNSSCETDTVKNFMGKMGFRNQGIWAFYNQGSTAFADSFLGVKYFASRFDSTEKGYEPVTLIEDVDGMNALKYYTFENDNVLALASFVDSEKIEEIDITSENLFDIQNQIAAAYNFDGKIYSEANVSEVRLCGNVELSDEFREHLNRNNVNVVMLDGDGVRPHGDGVRPHGAEDSSDEVQYVAGSGYIEFDVNIEEDNRNLYMYFSAPKWQGARIYVDGLDWEDYFSDWRWAIEKAGRYNAGRTVPIRIVATSDKMILSDFYLYEEDLSKLDEWREKAASLGADSVDLYKISSSHIKGSYKAAKDSTLLMTIPYDKGWHIKLDGKTVEAKEAMSALMAIDTVAGEHEIEMYYLPQGLIIGAIISLIGLILLVVVSISFVIMKNYEDL